MKGYLFSFKIMYLAYKELLCFNSFDINLLLKMAIVKIILHGIIIFYNKL